MRALTALASLLCLALAGCSDWTTEPRGCPSWRCTSQLEVIRWAPLPPPDTGPAR